VETLLQRLMAIEGVTGAMVLGKDGTVRASTLTGREEEVLAAMAAAAFDAATRYIDQAGVGGVRQALFETAGGAVQIADAGDALVVARSAHHLHLGRVRLELSQAQARLARQPGRPPRR
jgi:predicted regulator of Ras-like GTPase activity (Roadblock/LC7/MglB family)